VKRARTAADKQRMRRTTIVPFLTAAGAIAILPPTLIHFTAGRTGASARA
jgi:hypothetical protein